MSDASATKEDYLKVCADLGREADVEILAVLNSAVDDSFLERTKKRLIEDDFNRGLEEIFSRLADNARDIMTREPIIEFDLHLHGNKRNERNEMYRRRLTDEDADILYKTLRSNTFVIGLDLGYNTIGDDGAKLLGQLLQETVCLQWLVLSYNDIGPAGGEAIAKGLQVNETLSKLRLNGNKIKTKGGMAIAGALQVNTMLEELDLAETDQEIESIIAMATVLNFNNTLKSVNLNRPQLFTRQEEPTVHMALMLKVNVRLREIHLAHYDMRDFGAARLTENLLDNLTLTHLDLKSNNITRDGAKQLAILLKNNTPLEVLNLSHNRIEDDGAVALAEALAAYNTNLTSLLICSNNIASEGLCAVAKAMRSNGSLHALYIWGNKLEEPACKAFQDLLNGPIPRLEPQYTDVEPYVVDGVVYLARL